MASASAPAASSGDEPPSSPPPPPSHEDVLSFWFGPLWRQAVRDPLAWPAEANKKWFLGGPAVDEEVRARFLPLLEALSPAGDGGDKNADGDKKDGDGGAPLPASPPSRWLDDDLDAASGADAAPDFLPLCALAGIVAMDQFSRHAYRGTARAFALDAEALRWSRALLSARGGGLHRRLAPAARMFVLLPLEHCEGLDTQRESVALFEELAADARAAANGAAAEDAAAASALVANTQSTLDFARKHRDAVERWGRFPGRNAALGRESTAEEAEGLASGAIARW